ncbi:MAG: hypothetical protein HC900_13860 [Methylacidiphilales bacterium]|nr:hypothetical protein [Candidatus Methylacidiphilales bacterium]
MATYTARMMSADGAGEGHYTFEAEADLMKKTADEIVGVFFAHVEKDVLKQHVDWELNGVEQEQETRRCHRNGRLDHGRRPSGDAFSCYDLGQLNRHLVCFRQKRDRFLSIKDPTKQRAKDVCHSIGGG